MTRLAPRPTPDAAARDAALPPPLPRTDPVGRLPILILYPHSRCNCRCVMCDIWRVRDRRELAPEAVSSWLPDLRALGVRRVVLSGGEALLHSRLREICEALGAEGIGITLVTTGLLLERDADWLVDRCDDVVVSLDGPGEVHDRIRRIPGAFGKLAAGVRAVKDAGSAVRVSGRCTVQRENFRHLRATVGAARAVGLDAVSFLAADVSSEAFNRPGGWAPERAREVALAAGDLGPLAGELDALEAEEADAFASGFIVEAAAKLRARLLDYFAALAGRGAFPEVRCNAPWVSSVVESDGTLRPCFFQPPIGNVFEAGGLDAALNSEDAVRWRRGLDVARDAICRRCVCSLLLREGAEEAAAAGATEAP